MSIKMLLPYTYPLPNVAESSIHLPQLVGRGDPFLVVGPGFEFDNFGIFSLLPLGFDGYVLAAELIVTSCWRMHMQ